MRKFLGWRLQNPLFPKKEEYYFYPWRRAKSGVTGPGILVVDGIDNYAFEVQFRQGGGGRLEKFRI